MDYYDMCSLIEDLIVLLHSKEQELMRLQLTKTTNGVNQNVNLNQIF